MALRDLLILNRERIKVLSRATLLAQSVPQPTEEELERGIPLFIDQLISLFERAEREPDEDIGKVAAEYGAQLYRLGFTLSEVVHGYGAVCQVVMTLADQADAHISPRDFETFNRNLDVAIAEAVTEFQTRRDQEASQREADQVGVMVHELRNAVSTASLSFTAIKNGLVGINGQTASVLERSLKRMNVLIDRTLSDVRLKAGTQPHHERLNLNVMVDDIVSTMRRESELGGKRLEVKIDHQLMIHADQQLLVSILTNLIQNAIKFTRSGGLVVVRCAELNADRLIIEVEDECGGLPPGRPEELFHPFVRRTQRLPGVGLGLAIVARAVKAHEGEVRVRNAPGKGCVFSVELPRSRPADRIDTAPRSSS